MSADPRPAALGCIVTACALGAVYVMLMAAPDVRPWLALVYAAGCACVVLALRPAR